MGCTETNRALIKTSKSTQEQEYATPGLFAMDAVTAEYQVRHCCQCQSALKKETLLSSSVELNVEHCTLTNTCMQRAGPARTASQNDRAFRESEHARVQWWVHNDLEREWLSVIDDALEILPWQTLKCRVAYSYNGVWWHVRAPFDQTLCEHSGVLVENSA